MGCQKTLKMPRNEFPLLLTKVWHQNKANVRRMKQVCMPEVAVCWLDVGTTQRVRSGIRSAWSR
jgi:hypothetical protein